MVILHVGHVLFSSRCLTRQLLQTKMKQKKRRIVLMLLMIIQNVANI